MTIDGSRSKRKLRSRYIIYGVALAVLLWILRLPVVGVSYDSVRIKQCGGDETCLQNLVLGRMTDKQLQGGYQLLTKIYNEVPEFGKNCHSFGERLAKEIYKKYPNYESFELTPETAVCNYGFYQVYPREILMDTGSVSRAKALCDKTAHEIGNAVPGAEAECYRGIGRGLPFAFGIEKDIFRMAAKAVESCSTLSTKRTDDYETCLAGIFNGIQNVQIAHQHGLVVNEDDPMELCRAQDDASAKTACFANYKKTAVSLVNPSISYLDALVVLQRLFGPDATEAEIGNAIHRLGYIRGETEVSEKAFDAAIRDCTSLPMFYSRRCIQGYSIGLLKNGVPGSQHEAVLGFCEEVRRSVPTLPHDDCPGSQVLGYIRGIYPREKFEQICADVATRFGTDCDRLAPKRYGL